MKTMMNNMKHLLPYTYGLTANGIAWIIMIAIGIFLEIFSRGTMPSGPFFYALSGVFSIQLIMSLNSSAFITASPLRRDLQLRIPVQMTLLFNAISMTLILIFRGVFLQIAPETAGRQTATFFMSCIIMLGLAVFCGSAYKYFFPTFVIFCFFAAFWGGMSGFFCELWGTTLYTLLENLMLPAFGWMILIGILTVCLSALLHYLTAKAVYSAPVDPRAQGFFLRKHLS